jgi:hypothetical protein
MPVIQIVTDHSGSDMEEDIDSRNTENDKRDNRKCVHLSVQHPEEGKAEA